MDSQSTELCGANGSYSWLVHDAKHGYNIPVFRLGDKLGEDSNVIQGALSVGHPHDPLEEVNVSVHPRVIVGYR